MQVTWAYMWNPKESTTITKQQKLLKVINEFSKIREYTINILKLDAFLYESNEQFKNKTTSFTVVLKGKIQKNLSKEIHKFNIETIIFCWTKLKTSIMERSSMFMDRKT